MLNLEVDKDILEFIEEQKCANICCLKPNGTPYCFSCYFAFDNDDMMLFFKSSSDTNHIPYLLANQNIAGTILPDKLKNLIVQGIQFEGIFILDDEVLFKKASKKYHSKFPFALMIPGKIWVVQLNTIKMTDSTKGFGTKINWQRNMELELSNQ